MNKYQLKAFGNIVASDDGIKKIAGLGSLLFGGPSKGLKANSISAGKSALMTAGVGAPVGVAIVGYNYIKGPLKVSGPVPFNTGI